MKAIEEKQKLFNVVILVIIVFAVYFLCIYNKVAEVEILSFSDLHAPIDKKKLNTSQFITAIKDWTNENTIIVSGGDNYFGDLTSNLLYGMPIIDLLKTIKLDVSAVGNNEFIWGFDILKKLNEEILHISSNVLCKNTNKYVFQPYFIKNINGINVAFIGLTTQETLDQVQKKYIENFIFVDPVDSVKKIINKVKKNLI